MSKHQKNLIDYAVGGQAVMEGVMMRSRNYTVVSVRKPDGTIAVLTKEYRNLIHRLRWLNIPFLRGVINLFEMMYIGTQALLFASEQALDDGEKKEEPKTKKSEFWSNMALVFTLIFSLAFTLFLFKFVPFSLTSLASAYWPALSENYLLFNALDGGIKIAIFVGYLFLISLLPDIRRVFQYHGAEHKSITAYEQGLELSVENARQATRFHPRCGTSFIILVFLISIVVYSVLPKGDGFLSGFAARIIFLPLIAGFSYEILKLSAKFPENIFLKPLSWPGLLLQRLTTKEPDDQMLEVALHSLKLSLNLEAQKPDSYVS